MAKDAYWFPHDSNARHDPKMTRLRMKFGLSGVGFFWCCVEFLRDQDEYKASLNDFDTLCFEFGIESTVIDEMIDIGLLTNDGDGIVYSDSLKNRMFYWDEKKRKHSEAGKLGGRPRVKKESKNKSMIKPGFSNDKGMIKPGESQEKAKTEQNRTEQTNKHNKIEQKTPIPPKGEESDFDKFWKSYPNKTGKQAALKAWKKMKPNIDRCLSAVTVQRESEKWKKDNGQYIPNPLTWINQGRWDDEIAQTENNAGFEIV